MELRQRAIDAVHAQFGRPTGSWGCAAALLMAQRPSNRRRNSWAVSLLDVRRDDRVLEIGFGPGLAELRCLLQPGGLIAVAHQPRGPGATDETSAAKGREIAAALDRAGFSEVWLETMWLKPAVVCVVGVNGAGT
jgi:hypothetical protein